MKKTTVALCWVCVLSVIPGIRAETDPSIRKEAESIRSKLTLEEKVKLTYGDFYSGGIPRLGIDPLLVMDGPVGIRLSCIRRSKHRLGDEVQTGAREAEGLPDQTSALPSTLSLAASWDHRAAYDYASIIADEMLAINAHVLLAPGINLMRDPRGGRNFEYMGEDPFLTAEMAIQYARGLQEKRVGVNLKHYVANENDTLRHLTSSRVDEKTLREVYVYPFERAIREGEAWSVMTANNLLNEVHVGNSPQGLKEILREQIGFDGVILTDWRSAYQAKPSALATLDMTTGFCQYVYKDDLLALVKSGDVPEAMLDAMADRIISLYIKTGVIRPETRGKGAVNTPEFQSRIRELTASSMVLLKNENHLLPLAAGRKVVVTGPGAVDTISGGGSSAVNEGAQRQTILQGLQKALGEHVVHEPDSKKVHKKRALIVYCATGQPGQEGHDMDSILLDDNQAAEINRLGSLTDQLVVLLQNSSAVDMTAWDASADAVLLTWLGGQSFGDAVADVVTGKLNPSGRLPCTFGNPIEDYPCAKLGTWPAKPISATPFMEPGHSREDRAVTYAKAPQFIMDYSEKDRIGYRGFLANGIESAYPFGYGLSYTTFEIADLEIIPEGLDYLISCTVSNTGKRNGADVVQLYLTTPADPVKKLRGFRKVELKAGEHRTVTLKLRGNDLASFDPASKTWRASKGDYRIELSNESAVAPKLTAPIALEQEHTFCAP